MLRQVSVIPLTLRQRPAVFFLATQLQSLVIVLPLKLNLNLLVASTHEEQASQVDGHCSATPGSLHLEAVARVSTQTQFLKMFFPSFLVLKRNGESSQLVEEGGVGVGAVGVGATGEVE